MQVFVSHAHQDAQLAAALSEALQKEGLDVWNSELKLFPGDNWAAEVGRALEHSDAMVVLLTAHSIKSRWVRHEIEYALGAKRYSNRLIPVFVGGRENIPKSSIPWIVNTLPWVELKESGEDALGVEEIAEAIRSPSGLRSTESALQNAG